MGDFKAIISSEEKYGQAEHQVQRDLKSLKA